MDARSQRSIALIHHQSEVKIVKKGFTLIELLIVVAIIAILAAIAVPNFLEAQTRSKVSRVKADQRTVALAIQCYRVDNNKLFNGTDPIWDFLYWKSINGGVVCKAVHLTTPIAYLSSIPLDVFNSNSVQKGQDPHNAFLYNTIAQASFFYVYNYTVASPTGEQPIGPTDSFPGVTRYEWLLESSGPDLKFWPETVEPSPPAFYDPTNGTVSHGDIWYFDSAGLRGGGGR